MVTNGNLRKKDDLIMIKLYTKTVCPKCMLVKSMLNGAEIEFEVINIDENENGKNKVTEAGFMSVPIMEIDNKLIGDMTEIQKTVSEMS